MLTYSIFDDVIQLSDFVDNFFSIPYNRGTRADYPYIELYEGSDSLEIRAIIPGVNAEDLNVQLIDNKLVMEGEKKEDYTENLYLRKERLFGKFRKEIKLPYKVDGDKIHADLKNGILTINLVKSEEVKPKRIEVN